MTYETLYADLISFVSVVVIDLVLAGDNALVVGMAANRVAPHMRARAVAIGILLAIAFRILFATFAVSLLTFVGLLLIGGFLLLWVAWKLWRDIHAGQNDAMPAVEGAGSKSVAVVGFWSAIIRITIADISMSLDNVLAVAGAGRHNIAIMAAGLVLSIALMGTAAVFISRLLDRYAWLNYLGLAIVTLVALNMIYDGASELLALELLLQRG